VDYTVEGREKGVVTVALCHRSSQQAGQLTECDVIATLHRHQDITCLPPQVRLSGSHLPLVTDRAQDIMMLKVRVLGGIEFFFVIVGRINVA